MKTILLLSGLFLLTTAFVPFAENATVDGLWTGVYKSDSTKENVTVKFQDANRIELYCGGAEDENKYTGSYILRGDSVLVFTYTNSEGKQFTMEGSINKRKTYVDGYWKTSDQNKGSFYLKKEKIEELFIEP
jgi:hypothetical protein